MILKSAIRAAILFGGAMLAVSAAWAQSDVVNNGLFAGLTGWTMAVSAANSVGGTCGTVVLRRRAQDAHLQRRVPVYRQQHNHRNPWQRQPDRERLSLELRTVSGCRYPRRRRPQR